jgi:hypothetical protein
MARASRAALLGAQGGIVPAYVHHLLSAGAFTRHLHLWNPGLALLHADCDALIVSAYMFIAITLGHLTRKRRDCPFSWMLFAVPRKLRREGRFEDESWRMRKDGTRFWANVVIPPLRHRKAKSPDSPR